MKIRFSLQMIGDRLFVVDIVKAAKMHAQMYKSPVYLYEFGYRGTHSLSEYFSKSNEDYGEKVTGGKKKKTILLRSLSLFFSGASHADDTAYALRNVYVNVEDSESDKSLVPIVVEIWTSFALTG